MRGGTSRPGALIASPVFVGSVALLIVNDQVLKWAWPGLVTGKLSDVAGVAMVAVGLTALLGSRGLAFGLTATAFTALKTVPITAALMAPVLGGVTLTDPTDLVALAALLPLWRWVGRRPAADAASAAWLLPIQIVAVSCAVFATTATSCESPAVDALASADGSVYAAAESTIYRSDDFGRTWAGSGQVRWDASLSHVRFGGGTSCDADAPCVEISRTNRDVGVRSIVVDLLDGDERTTALTISSEQQERIDELAPPICGGAMASDALRIESAAGEHVVVAMGEAGVLHRAPEGEWEWAAVGEYGFEDDGIGPLGFAVSSTRDVGVWERFAWVGTAGLLLVPALLAAAVVPIRRLGARRGRDPVVAVVICVIAAIALAGVSLVVLSLTGSFHNEEARPSAALVVGLAAGVIAGLLLLVQLRPAAKRPDSAGRR